LKLDSFVGFRGGVFFGVIVAQSRISGDLALAGVKLCANSDTKMEDAFVLQLVILDSVWKSGRVTDKT
jgi:hypothetical protein